MIYMSSISLLFVEGRRNTSLLLLWTNWAGHVRAVDNLWDQGTRWGDRVLGNEQGMFDTDDLLVVQHCPLAQHTVVRLCRFVAPNFRIRNEKHQIRMIKLQPFLLRSSISRCMQLSNYDAGCTPSDRKILFLRSI